MRRTFPQLFEIELRFSCHVFDCLVLLVAHCSTCCHLMVPLLRPGAGWMFTSWRGVFCAIRDAVLEARAFTGEPLYALSCLLLACSGGPEEAGAPPDMFGKSNEKKYRRSRETSSRSFFFQAWRAGSQPPKRTTRTCERQAGQGVQRVPL